MNLLRFLLEGRLCQRCHQERTRYHFRDELCITCLTVEVMNKIRETHDELVAAINAAMGAPK